MKLQKFMELSLEEALRQGNFSMEDINIHTDCSGEVSSVELTYVAEERDLEDEPSSIEDPKSDLKEMFRRKK